MTAISASVVGCADDEFMSSSNGSTANLEGKLVDAQLLGFGVGEEAQTKAFDSMGSFIWMPTKLGDSGQIQGESNQRIGFCWIGTNSLDPANGALTAPDQRVFTNYEYEHVGWLKPNVDGPETDPCQADKLLNGAYINGKGGKPNADYNSDLSGAFSKYQYGFANATKNYPQGQSGEMELDLSTGLFRTENSSVFEGDYLVYFPYTNRFTKGQILATQPDHFDIDVKEDLYRSVSEYAFTIGYQKGYTGGQAMSKIKGKTLSSFALIDITNYISGITGSAQNIKKVILYSAKGILYEQELAANQCVDALEAGGITDGTALYYAGGKSAKTNAIYATLSTGDDKDYATVEYGSGKYQRILFPVLPQQLDDLTVIVINDQDQTCEIPVGKMDFASKRYAQIGINLAEQNFKPTYMAVDEETLVSALGKIYAANSGAYDENNVYTVKMLKSIALEHTMDDTYVDNEYNFIFNKDIIITADEAANQATEGGIQLTLTADDRMWLQSADSRATLTIDVPFVVEGAGCCGERPAMCVVGGMSSTDSKCVVKHTKPVTNYGTIALGNNVKTSGTEITYVDLTNKYDEFAEKRNKKENAATVHFLGHNTNINIAGTFENSGNVTSSYGIVDMDKFVATDDRLFAFEVDYKNEENVSENRVTFATINKLVNHENANYTVKGRSYLTVTTLENGENAVVMTETVEPGKALTTKDGRIDVLGASTNKGVIDNNGVINFNTASLQNEGLFIDQLSGQVGGKKISNGNGNGSTINYGETTYATDLNVKGIYVSKVATVARMKFALNDAVESNSVNVIEILGCDASFFNVEDLDSNGKLEKIDVYISSNNPIYFKSYNADNEATSKYFGHCVTVRNGKTLGVKDGLLKTSNDVIVESEATFKTESVKTADKSEVNIGGTLKNEGTVTHDATLLTAKNVENYSTFKSNQNFEVVENVVTNGNFDSNGALNKVGGNFTQDGDSSESTFAPQTTTTINGQFDCFAGIFTREELNENVAYRATVNVHKLGATKGTATTAWPTEM